jgi:predicted transcriptional regulator
MKHQDQTQSSRPSLVKMMPLEPNSSLARAYLMMSRSRCPNLPISSDDVVIGVVSERDIEEFVKNYTESVQKGCTKVIQVMRSPVTSVESDASLASIARTMLDERVGAVVIKRGNDVVGALTKDDLLEVLADLLKHKTHNLMDSLKMINETYSARNLDRG